MRAQQALEFLSLIGIVFLIVTFFIIYLTNQTEHFAMQSSVDYLEVTGKNIVQELKNMVASPSDMERNITIGEFQGTLEVVNGRELVLMNNLTPYVLFMNYYLNGQPCEGENRITRFSNILSICCDCARPPVTLPADIMCLHAPFQWKSCRSFIDGDPVRSVIGKCPMNATYARINITNSTGEVLSKTTDRHVSEWFFIDSHFGLFDESWYITIECWNETGLMEVKRLDPDFTPLYHCSDINMPGYYKITKNITTGGDCFNIRTENVYLEGPNATLTGDGSNVGIQAQSRHNITIARLSLRNFSNAILFDSVYESDIRHVRISNPLMEGSGTAMDPFQIEDCIDLQAMEQNLTAHYILAQDINCSATQAWNSGGGFIPLTGLSMGLPPATYFNGSLDGQGYVIYDLFLNHSANDLVSLFGATTSDAVIKNVTIKDADVTGNDYVGVIAGLNNASIADTYVYGTIIAGTVAGGIAGIHQDGTIYRSSADVFVNATDGHAGGLIGICAKDVALSSAYGNIDTQSNSAGGLIGFSTSSCVVNNSFARGDIRGMGTAGGFTGVVHTGARIENSYSTGNVTSGALSGGFAGHVLAGAICSENYYDTTINAMSDTKCAEPKNLGNMTAQSTFSGWNFTGMWTMRKYPVFNFSGQGTNENPFRIRSCEELEDISYQLNSTYLVTEDIDCAKSYGWDGGRGFRPIQNSTHGFHGVLNGTGHTVRDIFINRSTNDVGLFAHGDTAHVYDLRLSGAINGSDRVGGLFGKCFNCTLRRIVFEGSINGSSTVGGLIGQMKNGSIRDSYVRANINTSDTYSEFGGLVGQAQEYARIENAYFAGNITGGKDSIGGIVGENHAAGDSITVKNAFAVADIRQNQMTLSMSGIAGWNWAGAFLLEKAYWRNYSSRPDDCMFGATDNNENCTAISHTEYFFDMTNPPMDAWDTDVWQENAEDFPTLMAETLDAAIGTDVGIVCIGCEENHVENVSIMYATKGIHLENSENNTFTQNYICQNMVDFSCNASDLNEYPDDNVFRYSLCNWAGDSPTTC